MPSLLLVIFVFTLFSFIYGQVNFALPLATKEAFKNGAQVFGTIGSLNGVLVIFLTPLLCRTMDRFHHLINCSLAGVFYGLGFGVLIFSTSIEVFFVSTLLWTIGEILTNTYGETYLSTVAPKTHRARFNSLTPIIFGIGGAVVLRIILTLLTAYLLQITGLRLFGGLLLLYIVYKLYVDVIKGSENHDDIKVDNSSFFKAIWTILLADFTMSLDNVLGVAGAAGDHYGLLVFGLVLSIALMAFAATLISNWIKKYKWIAWAGLLAILIVAIELIYTDIQILFL